MNKNRRAAAAGHAWQIYSETQKPGSPGFFARLRAMPRMLKAASRGQYKGLGKSKLGLLIFSVIYILSPLDVVPDFIPFVGVADDLGVFMWLMATLVSAAGDYLSWEQGRPGVQTGEVFTDPQ